MGESEEAPGSFLLSRPSHFGHLESESADGKMFLVLFQINKVHIEEKNKRKYNIITEDQKHPVEVKKSGQLL